MAFGLRISLGADSPLCLLAMFLSAFCSPQILSARNCNIQKSNYAPTTSQTDVEPIQIINLNVTFFLVLLSMKGYITFHTFINM